MPYLASYHYKKRKAATILKCNKNHPLFTRMSNTILRNQLKAVSLYNIGSAFHTASLLLHFPPLRSAPDFSTPAFSVAPYLQGVSRCLLTAKNSSDERGGTMSRILDPLTSNSSTHR